MKISFGINLQHGNVDRAGTCGARRLVSDEASSRRAQGRLAIAAGAPPPGASDLCSGVPVPVSVRCVCLRAVVWVGVCARACTHLYPHNPTHECEAARAPTNASRCPRLHARTHSRGHARL
eukprot:611102-Pleurochrysis_carterae.AAC.1